MNTEHVALRIHYFMLVSIDDVIIMMAYTGSSRRFACSSNDSSCSRRDYQITYTRYCLEREGGT